MITFKQFINEAPIGPVKKGQMHKDLGKSPDAKITSNDIAKEKAKGGVFKKRAVFAQNAKKWHHEEFVNELSKETLGSYAKKAAGDAIKKGMTLNQPNNQSFKQHFDKASKISKRATGIKRAINKLTKEETVDEGWMGYSVKKLGEAYEGMEHLSDAAHELVMHADNHAQLHHGSHMPIINNLKKKAKKGVYDSEKAKKLWGYHADRAAQSYHKEYGDKATPWHKMFTTDDRKQAAAHWEKHHRDELNESVVDEVNKLITPQEFNKVKKDTLDRVMKRGNPMACANPLCKKYYNHPGKCSKK